MPQPPSITCTSHGVLVVQEHANDCVQAVFTPSGLNVCGAASARYAIHELADRLAEASEELRVLAGRAEDQS